LVLRDIAQGARVAEISRKPGVSDVPIYQWQKKYRGLQMS